MPAPAEGRVEVYKENWAGTRYDYPETVLNFLRRDSVPYPRYPAVFPSWDNTARQPLRGHSFDGIAPEAFRVYVEELFEAVTHGAKERNHAVSNRLKLCNQRREVILKELSQGWNNVVDKERRKLLKSWSQRSTQSILNLPKRQTNLLRTQRRSLSRPTILRLHLGQNQILCFK
jgi:hypothetical protein